jgi:exo-beta-1,3-glucanase (GH17 family)
VIRFIALALATIAAAADAGLSAAAQAVCNHSPAAAPALARLREALAHGRFVAYQPTSLRVTNGRVTPADPASIRADLTILRPRFDSLVTYDAVHGAENIPSIAASLKFRALIIGVWNPLDDAEVSAAIDAAHRYPRLVAGVSLGNERLFSKRSDFAGLTAVIASVRTRLPQTPLSTSEPFHIYYPESAAALLGELDFLLANVHPIFQPWFRDAPDSAGAQFVVNVVARLAQSYCGPILVKETGVPTAPASAGFTDARQTSFYRELRGRFPATNDHAFAYFAAFDAPWRSEDATAVPGAHPEEAHWGLYDAARHAKPAARELPLLTSPPTPP